jgi:hypothetical protein
MMSASSLMKYDPQKQAGLMSATSLESQRHRLPYNNPIMQDFPIPPNSFTGILMQHSAL